MTDPRSDPGTEPNSDAPDPDAPDDDGPANLLALVHVASNLIGRAFDPGVVAPFGLSIPEWRIVLSLAAGGADTAMAITAEWGMDKMAISRAVRSLAGRGLVQRKLDPADKRRRALSLTADGIALYNRIEPQATARYLELLEPLTATERRVLRRALGKLATRARNLA